MSGENLTPELARIIAGLRREISALQTRVYPSGAQILPDLDDVYINVVTRADGDVVTWIEANQDYELRAGSGGGSVPTDWVEWFVTGTQTGLAESGGVVGVNWDDSGSSGLTHGGAIILNGSGDAAVTEDGWYTLDCYVDMTADTAGTVWDRATGELRVNRSFAIGGDIQDAVVDFQQYQPAKNGSDQAFADASFSWTGYLMDGDTVQVFAKLRAVVAPGDTWSITEGQFRMEKLPM